MSTIELLPYKQPNAFMKLSDEEHARMSGQFQELKAHYEKQDRAVGEAFVFNSGYHGFFFELDGLKVYVFESPGVVGLEDHSAGGLSVSVAPSTKHWIVMRHADRHFGDVTPTGDEWDQGYALLPIILDRAFENSKRLAESRAVPGESVRIVECHESHPMNAEGGLYVKLAGTREDLVGEIGLGTARKLAKEEGFDPSGRTTYGFVSSGEEGATRSYWFHDQRR